MKICLLLLLVLPLFCISQSVLIPLDTATVLIPLDTATKMVSYSEVVTCSGTKDELYNKAKVWFADAFKNATYVLQTQDKEAGTLVGKANFNYSYDQNILNKRGKTTGSYNVNNSGDLTIKVFTKDEKYKYIITNITSTDALGFKSNFDWQTVDYAKPSNTDTVTYSQFSGLDTHIREIITSLKTAINKKADSDF